MTKPKGAPAKPTSGELRRGAFLICASPTHNPEPYSDGGEFDEGEVVGVVLLVSRCDGSEMLELAEEAFDQIAEAIEIAIEIRG
jgi:hypothetical protein